MTEKLFKTKEDFEECLVGLYLMLAEEDGRSTITLAFRLIWYMVIDVNSNGPHYLKSYVCPTCGMISHTHLY